jgi:hypothetical protein
MVGFAMASYAIANTIVVQIMPHVAKYVRRQILLAIATVINLGEMILWLFWKPTSDQLYLVFISVIAWGITDSIWKLKIFGKAYQLFAHGRWFSPGTPASSTTKTGRYDIAEILLKVALSTINQFKALCTI